MLGADLKKSLIIAGVTGVALFATFLYVDRKIREDISYAASTEAKLLSVGALLLGTYAGVKVAT